MCVAFAVLFSKAECGNFNFSEVLTDSNFFLLDFSTLFVNVMKKLALSWFALCESKVYWPE